MLEALEGGGDSLWDTVLPRLGSAVAALPEPSVIVLDNAHAIRPGAAAEALAVLAEHVPDGSTLVVAGRRDPALPLASLRERGRLLELGVDDLALTRHETDVLLRAVDLDVDDDLVSDIVRRTEGWPGAVALAVLSAQAGGRDALVEFSGDDRFVADYLRSEYLSALSPDLLRFLRRTSVLDRLTAPLCDAVLAKTGSAAVLDELERQHLFVVPLDHRREAYRYHRLFRELLQRELAREEPALVPKLNRRAAAWLEASGASEEAIAPATAAGDLDRVASIVTRLGARAHGQGRAADVERWLAPFDEPGVLGRYPGVAAIGAWLYAVAGSSDLARRWADAAASAASDDGLADGIEPIEPWLSVVRAALAPEGVESMLADAASAAGALGPDSAWRPAALLLKGVGHALRGESARAGEVLGNAADEARRLECPHVEAAALAQLAVLGAAGGDPQSTDELALAAADASPALGDAYATHALPLATAARALLRHGKQDHARARLAEARRLSGLLGVGSFFWLAVQVRLELAHAYLTLRDLGEAGAMLAEIDLVRRASGDLGALEGAVDALRAEVETARPESAHALSGLTPAELRLLPLLATHLSFREIGERLFVSRNTVKTQAISVYRKLGVSARSTAIIRAVELGLIEQSVPPPRGFTLSG